MNTLKKPSEKWPALNFTAMQDTLETLHQWLQIVGKIRLNSMPWQNHSWHSTLYVSSNGFTTQAIPLGGRLIELEFDFKRQVLAIRCSDTTEATVALKTRTVASFYEALMLQLKSLGVEVSIHAAPNEMDPAIPFAENTSNQVYDPELALTLWQTMVQVNAVFTEFRSGFIGKSSPVHLFWGAFDLAVSRFSGKDAPLHPGGMPNMPLKVMQEAYSKEVSSAGFWPGSKDAPNPVFYSYVYPTPAAFSEQKVLPEAAYFSPEMGEYFLDYATVQQSEDPARMLMDFLTSTYEAAANAANWDRKGLERQ